MKIIFREVGTTWRALGLQPRAILAGTFLINTGSYLVLPIFAIYMRDALAFSSVQIAFVLTTRLWAQEGLGILGGALVDRWGWRPLVIAGALIRCTGFVFLAYSTSVEAVAAAALLLGIGAALYLPAAKVALVHGLSSELRIMVFALRNLAANAGVALGPLIGALFLDTPDALFLFAALAYVAFSILIVIVVRIPESAREARVRSAGGIPRPRRMHAGLIGLAVVGSFVGGLFMTQLHFSLAVTAFESAGRWGPAVLFCVNSVIVIAAQAPVGLLLARYADAPPGMGAAFLMFCLCFGTLASLQTSLGVMIAAVMAFTIGEVMLFPLLDSMMARAVPTSWLGKGFGALGAAYALGGATGNGIYAYAESLGTSLWTSLGFLAFASMVLSWLAGLGMARKRI